jgi:hypothetical protein
LLFLPPDPGNERIDRAGGIYFRLYSLLAREHGRLAGANVESEAIPTYVRAALKDSDLRGMLGISGDHLVTPSGSECHRSPGHLYLVGIALIERAQGHEHRALRQ